MAHETVSHSEHLAWCKERALEYLKSASNLDKDCLKNAWASFVSDMNKHPSTRDHTALPLGLMLYLSGKLDTVAEMRKFINDFN